MAPEPAPGRRMVPLVPALVMLGLMAGAHGDSKSDSSSYRYTMLESDLPPSRSLECNTGLGLGKKKQDDHREACSPPALETRTGKALFPGVPAPTSSEQPAEHLGIPSALQSGACLSLTLLYRAGEPCLGFM